MCSKNLFSALYFLLSPYSFLCTMLSARTCSAAGYDDHTAIFYFSAFTFGNTIGF